MKLNKINILMNLVFLLFFPVGALLASDADTSSEEEHGFGSVDLFGFSLDNDEQSDESLKLKCGSSIDFGCNIPAEYNAATQLSAFEIVKLIETKDLKPLGIKSGYGSTFLTVDGSVIKLAPDRAEFRVIEFLLYKKFNKIPAIHRLIACSGGQSFRIPQNLSEFSTLIEMERGDATLDTWFKTQKSLSEKLTVLKQLAVAVLDLHESIEFMHGDLKPANILVNNNDVRLIDFDSSKEFGTSLGKNEGTIYYSNYLLNAQGGADAKIDIFSFGLIAYEMFHNQRFFVQEDSEAQIYEMKRILAQRDGESIQLINNRLDSGLPTNISELIVSSMLCHTFKVIINHISSMMDEI